MCIRDRPYPWCGDDDNEKILHGGIESAMEKYLKGLTGGTIGGLSTDDDSIRQNSYGIRGKR